MPKLTSEKTQQFTDLQHRRDCAFVSKHIESDKLLREKFAPLHDKEAAIDGIATHYRKIMDKVEKDSAKVYVKIALSDWTSEQIFNHTYDDAFDFKKRR